jgi:hypothetical protein
VRVPSIAHNTSRNIGGAGRGDVTVGVWAVARVMLSVRRSKRWMRPLMFPAQSWQPRRGSPQRRVLRRQAGAARWWWRSGGGLSARYRRRASEARVPRWDRSRDRCDYLADRWESTRAAQGTFRLVTLGKSGHVAGAGAIGADLTRMPLAHESMACVTRAQRPHAIQASASTLRDGLLRPRLRRCVEVDASLPVLFVVKGITRGSRRLR